MSEAGHEAPKPTNVEQNMKIGVDAENNISLEAERDENLDRDANDPGSSIDHG